MCRGGWYTFSFRYAQALIKGPSLSLVVLSLGHFTLSAGCQSVRPFPLNTPACMCCCCAGCDPRLLFFFFLLMARQIHSSPPQGLRANLQQLGVRLSRARDFCWGSPRPDGKMHVGTLSSFNSRPGWAGLVWPVFFFLPQPWGGAIKGPRGIPRDCKSAAQTAKWKVLPRCDYGMGTPSTTNGPRRRRTADDGRMDDQAHGSRKRKATETKTNEPLRTHRQWSSLLLMLTLRSAARAQS